jgi:DNA mismatch repair protein PMS2
VDLGLAPVDDMTIREHMDVFEKNGFGFVDDAATGRLKLASVPFSKGTTFGPDDVHELVRTPRCMRAPGWDSNGAV